MSITLNLTEQTNGLSLSSQSYNVSLSSDSVTEITLTTAVNPTRIRGSGSPVSSVTPSFAGQIYIDTDPYGSVYVADGLTSTDWIELTRNF